MPTRSESEASKALYLWSAISRGNAAALMPILHRVAGRPSTPARMDDVCFLGEDVAVAFMHREGERDAKRLGGVLPIDVLSSRYAVEVKAGLLGNGPNAQQWRLTFSEARGAEERKLRAMTDAEKKAYRLAKQRDILDRKQAFLVDLRKLTGRAIQAVTITMIVDVRRMDVDVFWFDGWHHRIGWRSREAEIGFRGSFHVSWQGR